METAYDHLYPHLFTLFVAPPGVGKSQAIKRVSALWKLVPELKVAPDNVTKAALIDALAESKRYVKIPGEALPTEFCSMQFAAGELGVLMPSHDLDFLSALNNIYDAPENYRERRRTLKEVIDIPRPQLNILAGSQPAFLASIIPEEAWGMGFTSRLIMIYSGDAVRVPLFAKPSSAKTQTEFLVSHLRKAAKLYGRFSWSADAMDHIQAWEDAGRPPEPEHTKMEHYNARRILHLQKLAMISSVSRGTDLIIRKIDVERALDWLIGAELTMPDVFRNMASKSDAQVIGELHFFAWQIWAKEQRPIHESRLIHFLSGKVPSDKIPKILEIAERSRVLSRMAGTETYKPTPKHTHGVE